LPEREGLDADSIDVGVVGTSAIAQRLHIPEYENHEQARIAAICDVEEEKASAVADEYDVPNYYTNYEIMLDGATSTRSASVCRTTCTTTWSSRRWSETSQSSARSR